MDSVREQLLVSGSVQLELNGDLAADRLAVLCRLGRLQPDQSWRSDHVPLPAAKRHRPTVPQQEGVAGLDVIVEGRHETRWGEAERQYGRPPAVDHRGVEPAIAPRRLYGTQQHEVGIEVDVPRRAAWGAREVGDARVQRVPWVYGKPDQCVDALVAAGIAELLQELLEAAGYAVTTAASGAEALQLAGCTRFDLVVSDLRMPDVDGAALWRALRQQQPALAQRMLFVTGDTLSPAAERFVSDTGCPSLDKPFSRRDLLARLQLLLQR